RCALLLPLPDVPALRAVAPRLPSPCGYLPPRAPCALPPISSGPGARLALPDCERMRSRPHQQGGAQAPSLLRLRPRRASDPVHAFCQLAPCPLLRSAAGFLPVYGVSLRPRAVWLLPPGHWLPTASGVALPRLSAWPPAVAPLPRLSA